MFAHLTATTDLGETFTWKGHGDLADGVVRSWKAKGYTVSDSRTAPKVIAAAAAAPAAKVEQTGRVGKGVVVHRITAGHADCGASYRRNRMINGGRGREVRITGEAVTCRSC